MVKELLFGAGNSWNFGMSFILSAARIPIEKFPLETRTFAFKDFTCRKQSQFYLHIIWILNLPKKPQILQKALHLDYTKQVQSLHYCKEDQLL